MREVMDDHEIGSKLMFATQRSVSDREWLPTVIELSGDIQRRLIALRGVAAAARPMTHDHYMLLEGDVCVPWKHHLKALIAAVRALDERGSVGELDKEG